MSTIRLIGVDAPTFSAGIVIHNGKVSCASPVVKYMVGWSESKVTDYCHKKGWHIGEVTLRLLMKGAWEIGPQCTKCLAE